MQRSRSIGPMHAPSDAESAAGPSKPAGGIVRSATQGSAGGRPSKKHKVAESSFASDLAAEAAVSPSGASVQVGRDPFPELDPETHDLALQWTDIDMYVAEAQKTNPAKGKAVVGATKGNVPVIRLFGVTEAGNSVVVHVHGFTPYFFCEPPAPSFTQEQTPAFRMSLEDRVREGARGEVPPTLVMAVMLERKQTILGYRGGEYIDNMVKVMLALPHLVPTARSVLERGFRCPGFSDHRYRTFESNVPFVLRFMVDNDIVGGNWVEMPRATYQRRTGSANCKSRCQAEFDVFYNELVSHPTSVPRWLKVAPLRILSFDIECQGRKGFFPDAKHDAVIQIANFVTVQGESKARVRNVFTLGGCLPIVGAEIHSFDNETDLLVAWSQFVRAADPDILTGYNIQNFDLAYLMERSETLKCDREFKKLGRQTDKQATMKKQTFSSSAHGTRESWEYSIHGRIIMDMIQYMWRNHKLSSYSLNAVSAEFLGQQKEDVHHSIISDLQQGTDEDRRRLAVYCLKDAYLPQQLMDKLHVLTNYVEMARVTGVPISFLFSRGQQIKVLSMLYRKARSLDLLIPVVPRSPQGSNGVAYEGATVIEPKRGYYDVPIATLDFASLYPSIMMAHNLCYTTLVTAGDLKPGPQGEPPRLSPDQVEKSPTGHYFVKPEVQKGILPTILEELLSARKVAKKDMKAATDPLEKAVMNGRQLALKISANSVYGFTGATVGQLPCIPISSSVTSYGRDMIEKTKKAVEAKYTIANGYPADADVVYGDTDSVMVKFGVPDVATAMKLGLEAADEVTKIFPKPVALEFEKVYFPYLLMNKKRYAGLYWTKPEKWDKMDCKGIETVRRDNCGLVRAIIGTCLRKILVERSVPSAIAYTKETISALLQNKVDISLLIITKSLSAKYDEAGGNKQAHVELAKRMRKRDAGSAPVTGDRVPYVVIQAAKKTPLFMKSEDPIHVLENNIPIDTKYYLDNQLSKPLMRIFEPIMGEEKSKSLLCGDHTRTVFKATPSNQTGLMRFAVKTEKCLGCRVPLKKGSEEEKGGLCRHCEPKRASLFLKANADCNALERRFAKLWTQCQRCQGSLHQDVLCTSRDCPIFYMRKKVQKDLGDVQKKIELISF